MRWLLPLALILILGALAWWKFRPAMQTGGAFIATPTVPVVAGDIQRTVRVTGTVAARNFASLLAPRVLGSRSNVNRGGMGGALSGGGGNDFNLVLLHLVKAGARVKKDDVVAQFDPTNQLLRLDDYKDAVIQTNNSIRKLIANLAANKEAHDQTVRGAKAAWDQATLDLRKAPVESAIDAENAKLTAEQDSATYKQLVFEDSLVVQSQAATIRVSELTKDQMAIELQRAEGNVKRMEMHSPMDGIAVMASIVRNGEFGQVREGDQVNAGQPFLTVVDPSSMVLDASVNQVDAESLRLGMKATVHLDAYPDIALPAVLEGIGAMSKTSTFRANYVSSIPVRFRIERTDARVIPDLTGSADVILGADTGTLILPRAAVFQEDGGSFVYTQGPDGWVKKQVEPGMRNYTQVAIRSGLQKGDVVALERPAGKS
ncbi:MAG TPA: HlyD family efflux transporter periplasmic adaptor subunit [Bryobacteraceae bacterium]|jgi:HlyD family secretion protein|nr:HlyD family efflux transporter periplasmic adaptor subunit [Bryobacteraceae bacterium]